MHFDVSISIPGYVVQGGLAAIAPVAVLLCLQLLVMAFMQSAMSLGGSPHFEFRVWGLVIAYLVVTFVIGALTSALCGNWWSGGIAGLFFALALYLIAKAIERARR